MNTAMMTNPTSRMGEYQGSKALSEIQGKMFLARQFPRDPDWALQNVLRECKRPELAQAAQYEYPKGDSVVKGASIRLVEVLARHWGNIDSGVQEIESTDGSTIIKCYAWDLETNVADEKTFSVKHERTVGRGVSRKSYALTDERDIYEMVANKGARRKRACLLAVMPGWYVDAALAECEATLKESIGEDLAEVTKKMVESFGVFGVTPEQIAAKLGKEIDKLNANDVVKLRHLYSAIKDGFVKATDAFGIATATPELPSASEENALEELNKQLQKGTGLNGTDKR